MSIFQLPVCLGCTVVESAAEPYAKATALLYLCGLRAREIIHVSPLWLEGDWLVVPSSMPCSCSYCERDPKGTTAPRRRSDEPVFGSKYDVDARALNLRALGELGDFLLSFIRGRHVSMADNTGRFTRALKSLGTSAASLYLERVNFLRHQGLDPKTIRTWIGTLSNLGPAHTHRLLDEWGDLIAPGMTMLYGPTE